MPYDDIQVEFIRDFTFSNNTTYGVGGTARGVYYPKNREEAKAIVKCLIETGQKFVVLGCGSNILASDSGFEGIVVSTRKLDRIYIENNCISCESGVTVAKLLKFCTENGVGGLEYLAGIPATVGGLTLMNGGIAQSHIEDNILEVEFFDGNLHNFTKKECQFTNKHSTMRDITGIICACKLKVVPQNKQITQYKIAEALKSRSHLPKGKSCGCVFKNGDNYIAGKIIDDCGLKGAKVGSAQVSTIHANFIINHGNCADDVYRLIQLVKRKVKVKTGIELEEEVVYIGEFNDTFC